MEPRPILTAINGKQIAAPECADGKNEIEHGRLDPLRATRKPPAAERIDEQPADVVRDAGDAEAAGRHGTRALR